MGNNKQTKLFLLMIKTLSVVLVLAVFSQMNCFKMPAKFCDPVRKIGTKVASDVMKCASSALKNSSHAKSVAAIAGKAAKLSGKVHLNLKVKLPSESEVAKKMVAAIMSKVGCRRRMGGFKHFIHSVGHLAHNVVNKGKKVAPIVAGLKDKALAIACKSFKNLCPKACDMGIQKITPIMKTPTFQP